MSRLELVRTDATKIAVATCRIVEPIDVIRYVLGCSVPTYVDSLLDPLLLQAAEEGLGNRFVPADGAPAHAGLKVVVLAKAPPRIAPVLRALIRMDQGLAGRRLRMAFICLQNQLPMDRCSDGPVDNPA